MTAYNATISSVNLNNTVPKKDGTGEYKAVTLVYTSNGKEFVKHIAHAYLNKATDLKSSIKSLTSGQDVTIEMDNYQLKSITLGHTAPTASFTKSGYKKSPSSNDPYGITVGHAYNCATQLVANGVIGLQDLQKVAEDIITKVESTKAKLSMGTLTSTPVEAAQTTAPQFDEDFNDEVPF